MYPSSEAIAKADCKVSVLLAVDIVLVHEFKYGSDHLM